MTYAHRFLAEIEFVKFEISLSLLAASAVIVCSNVRSIGVREQFVVVRFIEKPPFSKMGFRPGCVVSMFTRFAQYLIIHLQ